MSSFLHLSLIFCIVSLSYASPVSYSRHLPCRTCLSLRLAAQFFEENEDILKTLPPPLAAVAYYRGDDVYMFDAFMTAAVEPRRPSCNNLYETFVNIRDDEGEHVKTMNACVNAMIESQLELKNVSLMRAKMAKESSTTTESK